MTLEYNKHHHHIFEKLMIAHNPKLAKIRAEFFEKEYAFYREHINKKTVLVAGSGLGHDSFELVKHNSLVIGIDKIEPFVRFANNQVKHQNYFGDQLMKGKHYPVSFYHVDFMRFSDNKKNNFPFIQSAVLNMGTIGNFNDKKIIIYILSKVAEKFYFDFYPLGEKGLQIRKQMYEQEGWKNVRIENNGIVSDDGLESNCSSEKEINQIINSIGAKVIYHPIGEFAVMAEVNR